MWHLILKMTSQPDSPDPLFSDLLANGHAYVDLVNAANRLLVCNTVWTERLLLRMVRRLYTNRLRQLMLILPVEMTDELLTGIPAAKD